MQLVTVATMLFSSTNLHVSTVTKAAMFANTITDKNSQKFIEMCVLQFVIRL